MRAPNKSSLAALLLSNVLGGVGVASGIAVGALLISSLSSDAMAGFGQALSVLGAGLLAVPLARLASRSGRRRALTVGYSIAAAGAVVILVAAALGSLPLLLVGLLGFGAAQATNLQTRYAASELVAPERRGVTMSTVLWATTIGSVIGPNLSAVGGQMGEGLGIPRLGGPYLFSLAGFLLALLSVAALFTARSTAASSHSAGHRGGVSAHGDRMGLPPPRARRFAVLLMVGAHAAMVGIMSMTPLQLGHHGHGLEVVGIVISLHILGMYALSPLFGWLADKAGATAVALLGIALILTSVAVAFLIPHGVAGMSIALGILGLGWSAAIISASIMLANVDSGDIRVPLQGATDALMSYAAAGAGLLSGVVFAAVGFGWLAVLASLALVPAVVALRWATSSPRSSPAVPS